MKDRRQSYWEGLTLYPLEFFGHHLQGIVVAWSIAFGTLPVIVAAVMWAWLYACYQALTFLRKKDSAGLDVLDFMVGYGLTILVIVAHASITDTSYQIIEAVLQ